MVLAAIVVLVLSSFYSGTPESFESFIASKFQTLHEKEPNIKVYIVEFVGVGECVKCVNTSYTIKTLFQKDTLLSKHFRYIAVPITQRRRDAEAMKENNTIFDEFIPIKTQELSERSIEMKDKFVLLDKNLTIRYTVSADKYLSNNFIKDMILESRKIIGNNQ